MNLSCCFGFTGFDWEELSGHVGISAVLVLESYLS